MSPRRAGLIGISRWLYCIVFIMFFFSIAIMVQSKKGHCSVNILPSFSKVNQVNYTLISSYMTNIRILAQAVLKISCKQSFSNAIMAESKRGITLAY